MLNRQVLQVSAATLANNRGSDMEASHAEAQRGGGIDVGTSALRSQRLCVSLFSIVVLTTALPVCSKLPATEIALQLGPGGAASLANVSLDHPILLTAYSITRSQVGVMLLPMGWDSFQDQGELFSETSATADLLSEAAIADGLLFEPGESKSIGIPFLLRSDADGDGRIDLVDFSIWKSHRKQNLYGPAFGDFNYSGVVDYEDFQILVQEMGNSAVYTFDATTAIPEPGALATFSIGLSILFARRRSRSGTFVWKRRIPP